MATAYQDRFIRLAKDYEAKGVAVVAISVSREGADSLEKMKASVPYLRKLQV